MSRDKAMSLASANALMRQGDYGKAIETYLAIASATPVLAKSVRFNIEYCQRQLETAKTASGSGPNIKSSDVSALRHLLHAPIQDSEHARKLPEKETIFIMLSSCRGESLTFRHLEAAVACGLSSPFQRDLLWYIASLAGNLGLSNLFSGNQPREAVSLATLVALASSRRDWLLLRYGVQKMLGQVIDDIRLWDLLNNPPAKSVDSSRPLPAVRSTTDTYRWEKPRRAARSKHAHLLGSIAIGTILLNESKFIGLNLMQHYDMCDAWILVEGACQGYPTRKVSPEGLSLDDCATQIRIFPDPQHKLTFIQHGWTRATGEDAKSEIRNRYLQYCNSDFLWVVDADEFYEHDDINTAISALSDADIHAVTLPQVQFWKSTGRFITGEYYDVSHTRIYRHHWGMQYISNHNFPEIAGKHIFQRGHKKFPRNIVETRGIGFDYAGPRCYHMGFAKDDDDMRDKSDYYINRGEAVTRKATTESRAAWFTDNLPEKCKVRNWSGPLPEVLKFEQKVTV